MRFLIKLNEGAFENFGFLLLQVMWFGLKGEKVDKSKLALSDQSFDIKVAKMADVLPHMDVSLSAPNKRNETLKVLE